jgi:hypothetical protein
MGLCRPLGHLTHPSPKENTVATSRGSQNHCTRQRSSPFSSGSALGGGVEIWWGGSVNDTSKTSECVDEI